MITFRTEVPAHTKQERLYYLDWLRVLAVFGVFFFHTLRPFDTLVDWNIKTTPALALILTVYELLIRRVNAMRWLFGMKPRHQAPQENVKGGGTHGHREEVMDCL